MQAALLPMDGGELANIALRAAVQIDGLLGGRSESIDQIEQLIDALRLSAQEAPELASGWISPIKLSALHEAFVSVSGEKVASKSDFIDRYNSMLDYFQQFRSKNDAHLLEQMLTYCNKLYEELSEEVYAFDEASREECSRN